MTTTPTVTAPTPPSEIVALFFKNETQLVRLAREIAMDIQEIPVLLKTMAITQDQWEDIQRNQRFLEILQGEIVAWSGARNTAERVKIKSLSFIEEMLPELYARANDSKETLNAKVELIKTVAKFAEIGVGTAEVLASGERFTVTINLGTDQNIQIDKRLPTQVIDLEATEVAS